MFSGRPHRSVNLGSKKSSSIHDVLRNAEIQRQKREKSRKEISAITKIQNAWRCCQMIDDARKDLLNVIDSNRQLLQSVDNLALILPVFHDIPAQKQKQFITEFLESPEKSRFSPLLLNRLHILWNSPDYELHALGLRVLRAQAPPSIPPKIVATLLKSMLNDRDSYDWLSKSYPSEVFLVLLRQNWLDQVDVAAFRSFYNVESIPWEKLKLDKTIVDPLKTLLKIVLQDSREAWRFVFKIMEVLRIHNSLPRVLILENLNYFSQRPLIHNALVEFPLELAGICLELFGMAPYSKPTILLQMALASDIDPLAIFWQTYKKSKSYVSLILAAELLSYWLLVSTDYELFSRSLLGLDRNDLFDLISEIKHRCYLILWKYPLDGTENGKPFLTRSETSLLKLLKQMYLRDSRMHIFPLGFWLFEDSARKRFIEVFGNYLQGDRGRYQYLESIADDDMDFDDSSDTIKLNPNPAKRVLDHAPFFVAFETRVTLFSRFIAQDKMACEAQNMYPFRTGRHHHNINRETIVQDSQYIFASLGQNIKTELAVQLLSNGSPEAGIDGGGLTRELLMTLCHELLHEEPLKAKMPCFVETANHTLIPNPVFGETPSLLTPEIRTKYMFLGQIIGKCLYENLLIDVEFAPVFLSKWKNGVSLRSTFDDLSLLDKELYNSITKLHSLFGKEVEELGLDFTTVNSQHQVVELRPNGSKIPVTDSNKLEYMRELSHYKLNTVLKPQSAWFMLGLSQIIRPEWLSLFNPQELNNLISGESHGIDIDDLKAHTSITGFDQNSPTIVNLWSILEDFSPDLRAKFLKFVTSVPKPPLLGFSRLKPAFGITLAGYDDMRLPTASTCVNLLKLPDYSSREILKQKLLYAIEAKAGFELS